MEKITEAVIPEGALRVYYKAKEPGENNSGFIYTIMENGSEREVVLLKTCIWIKKLYIPSTVKYIAPDMLLRFKELEEIVVHENNASYCSEDGVLYNKKKTALIKCPENTDIEYFMLKQTLRKIERFALLGCSSIRELFVPVYVQRDDLISAMRTLKNLEAVHVDRRNHVYSSYDGMLFNYHKTRVLACPTKKTGTVELPETVIIISPYAFTGCMGITQIKLHEGIHTIGCLAFSDVCKVSEITLPSTLKTLEKEAFSYMMDLKKAVFKSVPQVDDRGSFFQGCSNLEEVSVPEGGERLIHSIFYHKNIKTVTIGKRRFYSRTPFQIGSFYSRESAQRKVLGDPLETLLHDHRYNMAGDTTFIVIAAVYDLILDKNEAAKKYIHENAANVLCTLCTSDNAELLRGVIDELADELSESDKNNIIDAAIKNTQSGGSAEPQIIVTDKFSSGTSVFDSLTL